MTDISFYHLTRTPLNHSLPRLLEKALDKEMLCLVLCPDDASMDALNEALWTYSERSFLPHGSAKEPHPEEQFIYLTTQEENPNSAQLLVSTHGIEPSAAYRSSFQRMAYMFDGGDESAVQQARSYWKALKAENLPLSYLQQNEQGGWVKQA